jgi:hypothetical protein
MSLVFGYPSNHNDLIGHRPLDIPNGVSRPVLNTGLKYLPQIVGRLVNENVVTLDEQSIRKALALSVIDLSESAIALVKCGYLELLHRFIAEKVEKWFNSETAFYALTLYESVGQLALSREQGTGVVILTFTTPQGSAWHFRIYSPTVLSVQEHALRCLSRVIADELTRYFKPIPSDETAPSIKTSVGSFQIFYSVDSGKIEITHKGKPVVCVHGTQMSSWSIVRADFDDYLFNLFMKDVEGL